MIEATIRTFVVQKLQAQDPGRGMVTGFEVEALSLLSLSVVELERRGREIERLQSREVADGDDDEKPAARQSVGGASKHRHVFDATGFCTAEKQGDIGPYVCGEKKKANGRPPKVKPAPVAGEGGGSAP